MHAEAHTERVQTSHFSASFFLFQENIFTKWLGGGCFCFLSISFPCFSEFISVYEVVKELI